jgi:heme exporter protein CcmD
MSGIVSGGWSFVWAAYAVSALVLGGYAVSVIRGFRAAVNKEQS